MLIAGDNKDPLNPLKSNLEVNLSYQTLMGASLLLTPLPSTAISSHFGRKTRKSTETLGRKWPSQNRKKRDSQIHGSRRSVAPLTLDSRRWNLTCFGSAAAVRRNPLHHFVFCMVQSRRRSRLGCDVLTVCLGSRALRATASAEDFYGSIYYSLVHWTSFRHQH